MSRFSPVLSLSNLPNAADFLPKVIQISDEAMSIVLRGNKGTSKIRLAGIDCPAKSQDLGIFLR